MMFVIYRVMLVFHVLSFQDDDDHEDNDDEGSGGDTARNVTPIIYRALLAASTHSCSCRGGLRSW